MAKRTFSGQIEQLARMTQKGFLHMEKQFNETISEKTSELGTELKKDISTVKIDLRETEERLLNAINSTEVKKHDFDALEERVTTLEE